MQKVDEKNNKNIRIESIKKDTIIKRIIPKVKKLKTAFVISFILRVGIYFSFFVADCLSLLTAKGTYKYYYNKVINLNDKIDGLQRQLAKKKTTISEIERLMKMTDIIPLDQSIISNFKIEYLNDILMPISKEFKITDFKNDLATDDSLIKFKSTNNVKIMGYVVNFSFTALFEDEVYKIMNYLDLALPGYVSTLSIELIKNAKDDDSEKKNNDTSVKVKMKFLWFYLMQ